jgi:hypothetical protein
VSDEHKRKPMATVTAPSIFSQEQEEETSEETFYRLVREADGLNPQAVGTPQELKRDALTMFNSWSALRGRAKRA